MRVFLFLFSLINDELADKRYSVRYQQANYRMCTSYNMTNIFFIFHIFLLFYLPKHSVFSPNAGKCGKNANQDNSKYGHSLCSESIRNTETIGDIVLEIMR